MEGKTLEELRKSILLVIAMADVAYERRRDAEKELAEFEKAVREDERHERDLMVDPW